MQDNNQPSIFISYSRKDSEIVYQVVRKLESAGFSVWIDRNGIESGDAYKRLIVNAIENCKAVVFFSSVSSNSSPWVEKEISISSDEGKRIIPVRLDDSKYNPEIKFDLGHLDYIEMMDQQQFSEATHRLIRSLNSLWISGNPGPDNDTLNKVTMTPQPERPRLMIKANYKSCALTLTLCLVGLIAVPFLYVLLTPTTKISPVPDEYWESAPGDSYAAISSSATFSKEGFIMDVDIPDCTYAAEIPDADSTIPAEVVGAASIEPEPSETPEVKYMEAGVDRLKAKEYSEAYRYFRQAAELGSSNAMYNLAISHLTGLGADIDTIQAKKWLMEAKGRYNEAAETKLEELNK